jgi:hypothetical protein
LYIFLFFYFLSFGTSSLLVNLTWLFRSSIEISPIPNQNFKQRYIS